ncbi:MAG: hypothetical protein JSR45_13445 [Proteobacteria bacterium]|nr:hypothetical protein [Pseudomonadota bacterium]
MSRSIWAVLGIASTRDRAEIRRAYAARLKLTQPEDDPEGFQRLREAYEQALRLVELQARYGEDFEVEFDDDGADEIEAGEPASEPRTHAWKPAEVRVAEDAQPVARSHDWRPAPEPDAAANDEAPQLRAHDWRPAPEPQAEAPSGRREREWRPPADPAPAEAEEKERRRLRKEAERAEAAHRALRQALHERLIAHAPEAEIVAAFEAVVASPAMEAVGVFSETETWLADLIMQTAPASDPLVRRAIAHFGWKAGRLGREHDASSRVLARDDDLAFLVAFKRPGHGHNPAYKALSRKSAGWRLWLDRLIPGRTSEVRNLLNLIHNERPSLINDLDPTAVAHWEAYLARPQLWAAPLWLVATIPLLLAPATAAELPPSWGLDSSSLLLIAGLYLAYVGLGLGLCFAVLHGYARIRHRWHEEHAYSAPLWLQFGWAPGALALVLLAAVLPPILPVTLVLGVLAAVVAYWAVITAEPDRREYVGEPWRLPIFYNPIWMAVTVVIYFFLIPGLRFPPLIRSIFAFAYLTIFWLLAGQNLYPPAWIQLGVALTGAVVAFSCGAGTLIDSWIPMLQGRQRMWILGVMAGAIVLAVAALIACKAYPGMMRISFALVACLVLAHKTPAAFLDEKSARARDLIMRYGWVAYLLLLAPSVGQGQFNMLMVAGLWMLGGVVTTVAVGISQTRKVLT